MNRNSKIISGVLAVALVISVSFLISLIMSQLSFAVNGIGSNHKNVTVTTHANITNARPEILNLTVYESLNYSYRNVTVSAGYLKTVLCNASVRDWNGFNDIIYANGTLWHSSSSYDAADNNNSHYTNSSCTLNTTGTPDVYGIYVCSFDVWYYSNNGTWTCNVSVMDTYNKSSSLTNTTLFLPVYALNVTDGIDYGNVPVEGYSFDVPANLTNLGNMPINISVEGYGTRRNDGLAMNCTVGNISVQWERYSLTNGIDSNTYLTSTTSLTSTLGGNPMVNLTIPKQNTSSLSFNTTYWSLYVPPNPFGNCTGVIIFTAQTS